MIFKFKFKDEEHSEECKLHFPSMRIFEAYFGDMEHSTKILKYERISGLHNS